MTLEQKQVLTKVPAVTLMFWIIKVQATTLGETGGDAFTMSFLGETTENAQGNGYLIGTGVFGVIFIAFVLIQIRAKKFQPFLYWATIIATTTVGTTLADFVTRSLGIGYIGGSVLLLSLVLTSLYVWYRKLGSVAIDTVSEPKAEMFYWLTIMISQTLGTALGDWTADDVGLNLGYTGAAMVFGGILILCAMAHYWTKVSKTALFWIAFIVTRPLGAVVGDFLDKPRHSGGLELDRYAASGVLATLIVVMILLFKQHPAEKSH